MADEGLDIPVHAPGARPAAEALEKVAAAAEKVGAKSREAAPQVESFSAKFQKIGDAARNLNETRAALGAVVGAVVDFGRAVNEQAIAGDRTRTALESLGGAYDLVQTATRGTVTASDAYRTQQTLAQAGIRTTDTALAAITRTAREHARALGIETPEALSQLTDALREGEQGGLRRFGIAVTSGATQAQTYASAIRQMETAQREASPSAITMAESTEQLSTAVTRVGNGLALWISQGAGLNSFFAQASTGARRLAADLDLINSRAASPEGRADAAERSAALAEYTRERAALRAELERTGGDTNALADNRDVGELTTAQLRGRASRMRDIRSPGDTAGGVLIGGVDPLAGDRNALSPQALSEAARALRTEIDNERAAAAAAARPAREYTDADAIAQASRDKGIDNASMLARQAANAGAAAAAAAAAQALAEARRASALALAAKQRDEAQRESAEVARLAESTSAVIAADLARVRAANDNERSNERGKGAEQSRLNRLADERSLNGEMRSLYAERASLAHTAAEAMKASFDGVGEALSTNIQLFVDGRASLSEALQGVAADSLKAISKQAYGKGAYYAAEALGMLAIGNFPGAGLAAASSAAFFAAGALTGAAGAAIAPTPATAPGSERAASVSPQRATGAAQGGAGAVVNNFYAPVIGGRTATEGESGMQVNRLTAAERRRTDRAA